MKILHIMGLDFTYKAAIRGYESVIITREWNGIGSMTLTINSEITNAGLIEVDDVIWFDNDYNKAHIIETIEEVQQGSNRSLRIVANHVNTLLRDYITIPPSGSAYHAVTGTREAVVRAWVNSNAISPTDTSRAQYPIALGTLRGFGASITEQTRYKPLSEEISRVLKPQDLGWCLELDLSNSRFVFNVLQGVDRKAGQSVNSRVLFGIQYGNISGFNKVKSNAAAKTVAYVGGQGTGASRTIVKVDASGTNRKKEIFIDSRDINISAQLTERGNQKLIEALPIDKFEFKVLNKQFQYETDYNLGDFVTVVIDKNTNSDLQIQKISEVYEKGLIQVVPEFGKPERTLSDIIGSLSNRLTVNETI